MDDVNLGRLKGEYPHIYEDVPEHERPVAKAEAIVNNPEFRFEIAKFFVSKGIVLNDYDYEHLIECDLRQALSGYFFDKIPDSYLEGIDSRLESRKKINQAVSHINKALNLITQVKENNSDDFNELIEERWLLGLHSGHFPKESFRCQDASAVKKSAQITGCDSTSWKFENGKLRYTGNDFDEMVQKHFGNEALKTLNKNRQLDKSTLEQFQSISSDPLDINTRQPDLTQLEYYGLLSEQLNQANRTDSFFTMEQSFKSAIGALEKAATPKQRKSINYFNFYRQLFLLADYYLPEYSIHHKETTVFYQLAKLVLTWAGVREGEPITQTIKNAIAHHKLKDGIYNKEQRQFGFNNARKADYHKYCLNIHREACLHVFDDVNYELCVTEQIEKREIKIKNRINKLFKV